MRKLLAILLIAVMSTMPVMAFAEEYYDVGSWVNTYVFNNLSLAFEPYDGMTPADIPAYDESLTAGMKTHPYTVMSATDAEKGIMVECYYERYADSEFKNFTDYIDAFTADLDTVFPDLKVEDISDPTNITFNGVDCFSFSFRFATLEIDVLMTEAQDEGVYTFMFIYPQTLAATALSDILQCFYSYDTASETDETDEAA